VIIALLVQRQSRPRVGDMLPTGNLPGADAGGAGSASGAAGMPSLEELAAMGPRAAADRLFERAMTEHEGGDIDRAQQFISMGLQAYGAVPAEEMDADGRFHIGLLQLLMGDADAAAASAAATLSGEPDHLLALILAARVADFRQNAAAAAEYRRRVRAVVEAAGGVPDRPEYESHRRIIDRELEGSGS
jgi:TolA-binding protein